MPKTENTKAAILEHVEAAREQLEQIPIPKRPFRGFIGFVREQGVVGLAVGLVLGTAAKTVVDSLVNNIFNPLIGLFTGGVDLGDKGVCLKSIEGACSSRLGYGQLLSDIIGFMTVALVIYLVVHGLKLDRLDGKKDKQ